MGFYELSMERNLSELKVHNEVYFGQDCYVGNSVHKIYKDFNEGNTKLIDMFLDHPELHTKFKELFQILSKNHFGKENTSEYEKKSAAENAATFTKKLPFHFSPRSCLFTFHQFQSQEKCIFWDLWLHPLLPMTNPKIFVTKC